MCRSPNETEMSSVVSEIMQGLCCADKVLLEDCVCVSLFVAFLWVMPGTNKDLR